MTANCSSTTIEHLNGSVALPYWETLLKVAKDLEVFTDIETLFPEIKKRQDLTSIPINLYLHLLNEGIKRYPDFGLQLGKSVTPKTYPVLGMTLLSCQNLSQVLEQVVRYESLNHDLGRSCFERNTAESSYSWIPNELVIINNKSEQCFHLVLSIFTGIYTFSPWLINQHFPIKRINFSFPEPLNADLYRRFFNTKIDFNQTTNSIVVDSNILDMPVLNGDTTTFNTLTSYADTLLQSKKQSITSQLKSILPEALRRQSFHIEAIAKKLNMSTRTLQRKLKESGNSYQSLLDETRQRIAELYLTDSLLSMTEIAFLVGYQEQSSFNHAFKGWNGISPSSFREKATTKTDLV